LLFAYASSFAWNTKGLVECNGLFLLDQDDRRARASYCMVSDSLQVDNWMVQGGYGYFSLDGSWSFNGEDELYSWSLVADKEMHLGYASVQTDYQFINFRLDVVSLPFFMASTHWNAPDSIAFAGAYYGRGKLDSIHVRWKSASSLSVIPVVDGTFEDEFQFRRFDAGTKVGKHRLDLGFTYGNTDPATDRLGYVFSDSSELWALDPHYFYGTSANEISLDYIYAYADMNYFGLLREKESEKRFLFVPVGLDVNLLRLDYKHYWYGVEKKDSYVSAHGIYAQVDFNIPWESRRFYETLAPNRALTSSIIKTLSFSVYNRSFRLYGSGAVHLADIGGEYAWDVGGSGWHFKPSVALDVFYANANVELSKRMETRNAITTRHVTDSLSWNVDVVGSLLNGVLALESPGGHFFVSVDASQVIPFYYELEKYPPDVEPVVDPSVTPEDPGAAPAATDDSDDGIFSRKTLSLLFKNGFMIRAKAGFFF